MSNPNRSPITTHVLDQSRGRAASGVPVRLERRVSPSEWKTLGQAITNSDGRVEDLLARGSRAERGIYRLTFDTAAYFASQGVTTFYPEVSVVFELVAPDEHHHVPLLVSPFGYSTYRGT